MPLTRISLGTAWHPAEFAQLSALFHECLVAEFDVPSADRFQFIERAADEQRIYDPHYLSEGPQRPLRAVSYFRWKTAQPGAETGTLSSALRAVRR